MRVTVVFGLSLFFIPDVFGSLNIDVPWLHTIKLIDIYSVLMGTSSVQATFTHIDYLWAMIYLVIATFVIIQLRGRYLPDIVLYRRRCLKCCWSSYDKFTELYLKESISGLSTSK